jgi:tetratricopeptide (TPR) repeat protein
MRPWPDRIQLARPPLRLFPLLALCIVATAVGAQQPAAPPAQAAEDPADAEAEPLRADLSEASEKIRAGAYDEADTLLAGLQADYPDDPALLLMRGEVLLALGRPADARDVLELGVRAGPERPRMHFQFGTALASTGDSDRALEEFALEIEANPDTAVQVLARLNRSLLLQQSHRWGQAAKELEAVLAIQPENSEVYGDLATLYLQAGDTAAALDALQRGREAGFNSAQHYYSLGARLYRSERYEDAEAMLSEALRVDPSLAEAERSLAAALERLGRDEEALAHLSRYLELRPDAPDAAAVSERLRAAGETAD